MNTFGLELSEPRVLMTRRGERIMRTGGKPTEAFWDAWRANKEAMKSAGWAVSKDGGEWQVTMWAATETPEEREAADRASRAVDAAIELPIGKDCVLYPFQRAGVAYALERKGALIADEMGLGKTVQAIAFANKVEAQRVLVVCPASVQLNWRREIMKWQTLDLPVHVIRPGLMFRGQQAAWYVINYDIVARFEDVLRREEWDVVVLDECHYLKTPDAKRTVALLGGRRNEPDPTSVRKTRRVNVDPIPAKRKLLLTGTPILNRPAELFPLVHFLDPARWGEAWQFRKRYCGHDGKGAENLDELQGRLRASVMVRRLKAQVLAELPAKQRQVVAIEPRDEATRALIQRELEMHESFERQIAEASGDMQRAQVAEDEAAYKAAVAKLREVQACAFSEMSRVRHEVGRAKLPSVIEHIRSIEHDGKLIVFAWHKDVIEALRGAFEADGVVCITGETPPDKRQAIVDRFQNDPAVRFFVGNIRAAGIGLTLTASSHVLFAESDWTPALLTQAEDRAHRIGQKDSVTVQHVLFDGSLDARMAKMTVAKQEVIDQSLDVRNERPTNGGGGVVNTVQVPVEITFEAPRAGQEEVMKELESEVRKAMSSAKSLAPEAVTVEQKEAAMKALRLLAGLDVDRARELNGVGFSKYDTQFGCDLAARTYLTPRQAAAALKMLRRYWRQYPADLHVEMYGTPRPE